MSETTPDAGDAADASPGTDVAVPSWGVEPLDIVDAEVEPDTDLPEVEGDALPGGAEVEPWAVTDEPGDWGFGEPEAAPGEPRQGDNDGARPGGGSTSLPRSERGGGTPFTGKKKRQRGGGGGGGGRGGIHISLFGGLFQGAGSNNSLLKTNTTIGSGNSAGIVNGSPGSRGRRPRAGKRR